jgi:steroid 5-alpha reductase family enzyme
LARNRSNINGYENLGKKTIAMSHWVWIAIVIEAMALVAWIAFAATHRVKYTFLFGFNVMLPVAFMHLAAGGRVDWREALAAVSVAVYLLNMNVVIMVWTRDTAMSKLDAHLATVEKHALPFLAANTAGGLYCLPFYFIGRRTGPLDWQDVLAVVVYVLGTIIHFWADLQKKRFKAKPEMKGLLLDQGLWRYSRHPNHFGDLLVYIGWAVFAANPWAWISPAINLLQYAFDAMPKNEKWAAERYGPMWSDYASRTSSFIPWVAGRHEGAR